MTKIIKLQVILPSNVEKRIVFSTDDKDALVKGVELDSRLWLLWICFSRKCNDLQLSQYNITMS